MARLDQCTLITLPEIADPRGSLLFAETQSHAPFAIERVFFLYDVPQGGARGGHAHHELQQLMIAVAGSFDVALDDGADRKRIRLSNPTQGLYIAPMIWREMENFSDGAVMAVLASKPYSAADYIRDYGEFTKLVAT